MLSSLHLLRILIYSGPQTRAATITGVTLAFASCENPLNVLVISTCISRDITSPKAFNVHLEYYILTGRF